MYMNSYKIADNRFKSKIEKKLIDDKIIRWYYHKKGVRFKIFNDSLIIPSRYEILNKNEIWWSESDIEYFKNEYIRFLARGF